MKNFSQLYKPRCVMCRQITRAASVAVETPCGLALCRLCQREINAIALDVLADIYEDQLAHTGEINLESEDYL